MKKSQTKVITESSLMIAFSTVLSVLKLIEMPYGGSVTLASMLPIVIIGYRHGVKMGILSGAAFAAVQQLLGLNNLAYFTTWYSILAVIMLDYFIAFTVVGVGGVLKNKLGASKLDIGTKQSLELATGMLLVCVLRYVCHVISGATVWAGLSIPSGAAIAYSLGYNATYMIPETIVNVIGAMLIGGIIDFSREIPTVIGGAKVTKNDKGTVACVVLHNVARLLLLFMIAFDTLMIAPRTQDAETGRFTFAALVEINWTLVVYISAACLVLSIGCMIAEYTIKKKK